MSSFLLNEWITPQKIRSAPALTARVVGFIGASTGGATPVLRRSNWRPPKGA